jgi:hypothetical protein
MHPWDVEESARIDAILARTPDAQDRRAAEGLDAPRVAAAAADPPSPEPSAPKRRRPSRKPAKRSRTTTPNSTTFPRFTLGS